MKDISLISHLNSLAEQLHNQPTKVGDGFTDMLTNAIKETNKNQIEADTAIEKLSTGEEKNIHNVMISVEKADISMRVLVQMRNKIVEAYQEIMRMQV